MRRRKGKESFCSKKEKVSLSWTSRRREGRGKEKKERKKGEGSKKERGEERMK